MSEKLTIPASYVNTMLNLACDRGLDRQELMDIVGIDPTLLAKDAPVSALNYGQLHHRITAAFDDEWFGMLSGGAVPPGSIRFLCQAIVHCKTLGDAIKRTSEFFELCRGFKIKQDLDIDGSVATVTIGRLSYISEDEFETILKETSTNTIKSTLMVWHGFSSWLIGQEIPLSHVYYPFSEKGKAKSKEDQAYPISYDQALCGFSCDSKYLQYPVIQQEDNIDGFLRRAPYHVFIQSSKTDETFTQRVKAILAKSMGDEFPNAPDAADRLNVSVTTLHRKLGQENTSFQQIKDEARMEAAIHYLNSPDISTATIAELVGFENPSTFFRSFKKWTGIPPGEYRKQLLSEVE